MNYIPPNVYFKNRESDLWTIQNQSTYWHNRLAPPDSPLELSSKKCSTIDIAMDMDIDTKVNTCFLNILNYYLLLPSILIYIIYSQKVAEIVREFTHTLLSASSKIVSHLTTARYRHKCFSHLPAFLPVPWDTFLHGWEFPVCFVPAFQFAKTGWNLLHHQYHKLNTAWNSRVCLRCP